MSHIKPRTRLYISNLISSDVKLLTALGMGQQITLLASIMNFTDTFECRDRLGLLINDLRCLIYALIPYCLYEQTD